MTYLCMYKFINACPHTAFHRRLKMNYRRVVNNMKTPNWANYVSEQEAITRTEKPRIFII